MSDTLHTVDTTPDSDGDTTLGTISTNALGETAAELRVKFGTLSEEEREVAVETYTEQARQLGVGDALDEWLSSTLGDGDGEPVSAGERLLIAHVFLFAAVAGDALGQRA